MPPDPVLRFRRRRAVGAGRRARRCCRARALVYVADSAGFPYGTRSEAEIAARVPALLGRLAERYDPRLIVIACNTASTIALQHVRAALDMPIVGTVPAIKPAAELSETRVIGVLGTEATVRQPYVDDLAARFAGDCIVLRHGSAELVELAEAKLRGEPADRRRLSRRARRAVRPDRAAIAIDVVVNACTHFPLVADELAAAAPHPVRFVDGAAGNRAACRASDRGTGMAGGARASRAVFTRNAAIPNASSRPRWRATASDRSRSRSSLHRRHRQRRRARPGSNSGPPVRDGRGARRDRRPCSRGGALLRFALAVIFIDLRAVSYCRSVAQAGARTVSLSRVRLKLESPAMSNPYHFAGVLC